MRENLPGLLAWILGTCVAALSGAVTAKAAAEFYGMLDRPSWSPPAWLFGPAWTVLYPLMAVAAWRVWREHGFAGAKLALTFYFVQLVLNASWSWVFFVKRSGPGATAVVVGMWLAIAATIITFWPLDRTAALMLLPYLAWVSFATALTVSVWRRNPTLL
ncbi:MAG: TspO/MBR family protein [Gemmatimonadota bacterium]